MTDDISIQVYSSIEKLSLQIFANPKYKEQMVKIVTKINRFFYFINFKYRNRCISRGVPLKKKRIAQIFLSRFDYASIVFYDLFKKLNATNN